MTIRPILLISFFFCLACSSQAQTTTLKLIGDSVKITNCDSAELIIENHTQAVNGFLYNTGNGRTVFKRGMVKLSDSAFLIGADTLRYNAWVQGGNKFGTTGVLGTKDNYGIDFYTNSQYKARFTAAGNMLIGTTADTGYRLNVNGPGAFFGNLKVGTATLTSAGSLLNTNAILFNHVVADDPYWQGNELYVSKLDNVLYNYQNRYRSTTTTDSTGTINIDIAFPRDEIFGTYQGIVYGDGYMCFSFLSYGIPQTISVMEHDSASNAWRGPFTTSANLSMTGAGFFAVHIQNVNYVNEIKIAITPTPGVTTQLYNLEYVLSRNPRQGLLNPYPYVGKTYTEYLYNDLYWKNAGALTARISSLPTSPNYFMNNVLIGASTDNGSGGKLQVTGGVTASGAVRFSGLTSDNTKTKVLVGDASGNLYFRDASTIAATGFLQTDLAGGAVLKMPLTVTGGIETSKMRVRPAGWADYVFAKDYRLFSLDSVESFVKSQGHLPGIPSVKDVLKNGIELGSFQVSLLKKIEELTLYAIDQAEQIKILKEELSQRTKEQDEQLKSFQEELTALKKMMLMNRADRSIKNKHVRKVK